MLMFAAEFDS